MANFRLFYNEGQALAINVDLVKLIRSTSSGEAEILFVGDTEPMVFAMSARDLHNALMNPHVKLG